VGRGDAILILQGNKAAHGTDRLFKRGTSYNDHLYEAHLHGHRMLVCVFSHPSARGDLRWADRSDYVKGTVHDALQKALRHL
jgi:hypothetical protein